MAEQLITKFCVIYDGEAHINHEINIMTLGRALTALGNVILDSNELINGDRSSVEVRVSDDFIAGSFGIEIEVIQNLPNAKNILSLLGFFASSAVPVSVISVINWLKGEKI